MKKIVFYDTETTGLPNWKEPSGNQNQPHLVQLSAIQCNAETREIMQRIDLIIRPNGWGIPQEVVDIHGITTEKAMDCGVWEPAAVGMLVELCRDSDRCAHNRTFDQRIIRIALKRYLDNETVDWWAEKDNHHCTMLQSKPIMKIPPYGKYGWKNPNLEEAYQFFTGRALGDKAHSSIFDTEACMAVYWGIQDWKKKEEEKEEVEVVDNPCTNCGKEWNPLTSDQCSHCGNECPF